MNSADSILQTPLQTINVACQVFVEELTKKFGILLKAVIRFGSTTRGHIKNHTDVDLFVVIDTPFLNLSEKRAATFEAEEAADRILKNLTQQGYFITVSALVRTPQQALEFTPLCLDMTLYSIVHFEDNSFANNLLERTRKKIDELGAVRKKRGLLWYWDLCPNFKPGDKAPF